MSIVRIVLLASVVLALAAIGYLLYLVRKHDVYTREKYAFAALAAFVAFAGTITTSIVGKESPWTTVASVIRPLFGLPEEPQQPRTTDHILLVIVLVIVANFIYKFYHHWPGAISNDEHQSTRVWMRRSLLRDGLSEAKYLVHRKARTIYLPTTSYPSFGPLDIPSDSLEWHLQAIDLIQLRNPSYRFSPDHGYHPEARCWIGEHPQVQQTIAVLCVPQEPAIAEIEAFLAYVARVKRRTLAPHELTAIVAIRDADLRAPIPLLGFTVQRYGEDALLDDLVDFSDYFDYLSRRVTKDTLADSDKTLEMVYAPSSCVVEGAKEPHKNVEDVLHEWLEERGQRQLALLGEYGQGKSTTALMFSYRLLSLGKKHSSRVPILIELRGRSPRNTTPEGLVAEWAYRFSRIAPKAVMKLIMAGRALVILEGFDEMALAGDAQARYAHFRTLWGFSYPKAKVLFTGRPNYFLDDRELRSALNIERSLAAGAYCESLRLEPFDIEQMKAALRAYPPTTRDNITALASANPKFCEVASRGSLLYVIGELWDRPGGLGQQGVNINSATVVGTFIRSTYERQASKLREVMNSSEPSRRPADFMVLNSSERQFIMRAIAYFMAICRLPNQITSQALQWAVGALYETLPEEISTRVSPASQEVNMPIRERLAGAEHVLESIITDVRACGLLVTDPSMTGTYKFAHKSFMEYLVAEVETDHTERMRHRDVFADFANEGSPFGVLIRIPEAMAFAAEIIVNKIRQSNLRESLRAELRHLILRRGSMGDLMLQCLDAATVMMLVPRIMRRLAPISNQNLLWVFPIKGSAMLRLVEDSPGLTNWALYVACCAVAGVTAGEPANPFEKTLASIARAWLEVNLPHLRVRENPAK